MNITSDSIANALSISWQSASNHDSCDMRAHCWREIVDECSGMFRLINWSTDPGAEAELRRQLLDDCKLLQRIAHDHSLRGPGK